MNALVLISLICVFQFVPSFCDDSAQTTTSADDTTTVVSVSPGSVVDFNEFDADLDDVYKSIAQIKSKASKLELIGPKIQSAMLHLEGDEEDVAHKLQAKYQQILPLLQKLKSDDSQTKNQAQAANRRRRDVSSTTDTEVDVAKIDNIDNAIQDVKMLHAEHGNTDDNDTEITEKTTTDFTQSDFWHINTDIDDTDDTDITTAIPIGSYVSNSTSSTVTPST